MSVRLSVNIGNRQPNPAALSVNHDFASRLDRLGSEGTSGIIMLPFRFRKRDSHPDAFAIEFIENFIGTPRSGSTGSQKQDEKEW